MKPRFRDPPAKCNAGRVIDMSAGGLRLKLSTRQRLVPGDRFPVILEGKQVVTRVAWVRSRFGTRTAGVEFETVTPEFRQLLSALAMSAVSVPQILTSSDHAATPQHSRPAGI